jgi:hypothetical protein
LSPAATLTGILDPSLLKAPGPTARTLASESSLTAVSGKKIPDAVLDSALILWTRIRSRRGASDLIDLKAVDYKKYSQQMTFENFHLVITILNNYEAAERYYSVLS